MQLVIDSNRFIAGLLKDSTSRRILFDRRHTFHSPDLLVEELERYKPYLIRKMRTDEKDFEKAISILLERVELVRFERFQDSMGAALEAMKDIDVDDSEFIAVGLAIHADGIWTEDRHFLRQGCIMVYTTRDLIGYRG